MDLEPLVVDPRQQIAPISVDAFPKDVEACGWILDGRLELGDVNGDGVGI